MSCSSIQRSLEWCQGRPELPGIKRRIYYISKYDIVKWPQLQHDTNGRLLSASYTSDFVLRADAKWKYIDVLADKSQLTSDPQGEYPSQTQLNKLVAVHPGVEAEASAAAAYLNNNDNVFLVEDMRGQYRVVGSEKWPTKTTVNQDLGQGTTGTTSTTINVEATDECPAPFYAGSIEVDDGTINPEGNPNQNTGGSTSGNPSAGGMPSYDNTVLINNSPCTVRKNSSQGIYGPITSIKITGENMNGLSIVYNNKETEVQIPVSNGGTEASWNGSISSPNTIDVYRGYSASGNAFEWWFTINVLAESEPNGD